MEWLNENTGILVLVFAVAIIALAVVIIVMLNKMLRNIAVQRLNFLGFYSADAQTREKYAELTIGNKSLNDVGLSELGIRNGKVNFNLTGLYKEKKGIAPDTRVVVEQRSSISFTLSAEELRIVLTDGKDGKKQLKTLRLYAVDLTGNLYQGRIGNVRKLLSELLAADKAAEKGTERTFVSALHIGKRPDAEPVAEGKPVAEESPVQPQPAEETAEIAAEEPVEETAPAEEVEEVPVVTEETVTEAPADEIGGETEAVGESETAEETEEIKE